MSEMALLLERYARVFDGHYEVVNDARDAAEIFAALRHAGPLARSIRDLARALEQALAVEPDDRSIRGLRDRAREIERTAEFLHSDARVTFEFMRTEQGESLARSGERLVKTADRLGLLATVIAVAAVVGVGTMLPDFPRFVLWTVLGVWLLAVVGKGWIKSAPTMDVVSRVSRFGRTLLPKARVPEPQIKASERE